MSVSIKTIHTNGKTREKPFKPPRFVYIKESIEILLSNPYLYTEVTWIEIKLHCFQIFNKEKV